MMASSNNHSAENMTSIDFNAILASLNAEMGSLVSYEAQRKPEKSQLRTDRGNELQPELGSLNSPLEPLNVAKPKTSTKTKSRNPPCLDSLNLMMPEVAKNASLEETLLRETPRVSAATCTTTVMDGKLENVQFDCSKIMEKIVPTERIRTIHSNFGARYWSESDRARDLAAMEKKIQKRIRDRVRKLKKELKKTDEKFLPSHYDKIEQTVRALPRDFNSQITFEVHSKALKN